MNLSTYRNGDFDRGASRAKEIAWLIVSELLVSGPIPGSGWRASVLRAFGSKIAGGVVLKPRVRIKFPWRLEIGATSWIGEGVWIDNLAPVRIGHDVCISQDAYLCTGSHDWTSSSFDLVTAGITIEDHCWVCARATVAAGTHMHKGAVLGSASLGSGQMQAWTIYAAGKATVIGPRRQDRPVADV